MMVTERIFPERPSMLEGFTESVETPNGRAYVTLNYYKGRPVEVFITLGKAGSKERADSEALARLLSYALQHGVPIRGLTKQIRGISSEEPNGFGPNKVLSMPDGVGIVLENLTLEE